MASTYKNVPVKLSHKGDLLGVCLGVSAKLIHLLDLGHFLKLFIFIWALFDVGYLILATVQDRG